MDHPEVSDILRTLIQFDTTNPPGRERPCIEYLAGLLQAGGVETTVIAKDEARPNLLARLRGAGTAPGLLLLGHVDVVTTAHQTWATPPFAGHVRDGFIWGRGALDMKAGVAMMTAAMLRMAARSRPPAGDILLAAVSDEEAGGTMGARFLVDAHPDVFRGIRYALGEFGGFPLYLAGTPTYMIQVGEKQPCWMEAVIRGPAGHGARPMRDGAMARLGSVLESLNRHRLPVHISPVVADMVEAMAGALPRSKRPIFRRLLQPRWTDRVLRMLGENGRNLEPLFRNTVNATIVRGGDKPNVIPSEIALGLDARLLPGFSPDDLLAELRPLLGPDLQYRILLYDASPPGVDLGLFPLLCEVLREGHPGSLQAPYLLPGSSDARFLTRLGIQTYGYTPMNLPPGFNFFDTIHAADERIPVGCVEFGAHAITEVLKRYGGAV